MQCSRKQCSAMQCNAMQWPCNAMQGKAKHMIRRTSRGDRSWLHFWQEGNGRDCCIFATMMFIFMVSFASCNFMPSVHFGHSWSWWKLSFQHYGVFRPKKVTIWCIGSFRLAFVACRLNNVLRKYNSTMDRRTSIDFGFDKLAGFLGFCLVDIYWAGLLTRFVACLAGRFEASS